MRILSIDAMALALAGCMAGTKAPPTQAGTVCDAASVQAFIGRNGAAMADEARRAAGAQSVRVIGPDQAVTMDFRPDRLNLETDAAGKVAKAGCG